MSALSNVAETPPKSANDSITSISTNARIDYILRFSKQAILVVDENADIYTQIAGQYVGNLSDKYNTSLLTISSRHNDIQIRCRIIEQLFGSVLFDPEQPLSVSILNFAKKSNEAVSIVLEQVQNLSLQLFHELCQLVEMGKKTRIEINVLMVGNLNAGTIVSQNKTLFKNKLSILSAQSGQLISINHPMFKKQGWINYAKVGYALLALSFSALLTVLGALALDKYEIINLEKILSSLSEEGEIKKINADTVDTQFVLPAKTKINGKINLEGADTSNLALKQTLSPLTTATTQDIVNALNVIPVVSDKLEKAEVKAEMQSSNDSNVLEVKKVAQPEVVQVFSVPVEEKIQAKNVDLSVVNPNVKALEEGVDNKATKPSIFNVQASYYQNIKSGFVIQISGFTTLKAYQEYVLDYPTIKYFTYLKNVNNREMMIMTTPVYSSRINAEKALKDLPSDIQNSGVWIKSVAAIHNEINSFNALAN